MCAMARGDVAFEKKGKCDSVERGCSFVRGYMFKVDRGERDEPSVSLLLLE